MDDAFVDEDILAVKPACKDDHSARSCAIQRQIDLKARVAGARNHADCAVMPLHHDAPRDAQAQTRPLPDVLGGEERFEQARLQIGGDAGPSSAISTTM